MKTSIITIGTEINLGQILNTNSQYIAEEIASLGLECNYMFTVRDELDEITYIINKALEVSDIIILSGGLGPTSDDITREAVAKSQGIKLVKDDGLDATSAKFLKRVRSKSIQKNLLKQSYIPEGSQPFTPRVGSASGFWLKKGNKNIFSIPGVPKEMRSMFVNDLKPELVRLLKEDSKGTKGIIVKKSALLTTDISESEIEEKIKDLIPGASKDGVKIGITATPGMIKITIIAKAEDIIKVDKKIKEYEEKIISRVGTSVYGRESSILPEVIKPLFTSGDLTLSLAESITGGLISSMITDTPGSSEFFLGSIISYSDFAKREILGIDKRLLLDKGAVSREVCEGMVNRVQALFGSDYSISVTGYAGPDAGEGKDVGRVFCGIKGPDGSVQVYDKNFLGTRTEIKFRVAQFVLNKLRLELTDKSNG